ncbi:beta-lactamase/transpeptidase-like protein [Rhypophila decipiens]|uniref:Beta-lactamase/transpeptidase-like protein n=1 Tax=Rhypophila decipiens TaxID=261697 RepID=A0AAN6Y172_9PEZI|nr:beta-lactamase/transpeptidase-like protein [Rhypophila decipiens]
MRRILVALAAIANLGTPINAKANCPLYGPLFPRPTNLAQSLAIQIAGYTLDDVFTRAIDNDSSTGSDHFSYAVEVFSGSEKKPLWSHYWTAPNLPSFNSSGVQKVDSNTVFRIGSITKVFTVLTFLATVGDGIWNDPVTKYVPEFAELAKKDPGGSMWAPDWDSITVGSLASQTSGIIRDYALLGELAYQVPLEDLRKIGFPDIPIEEFPPCGINPTCNRTQIMKGMGRTPPSFPPGTTPTYSDLGFVFLGNIAEKVTGRDFKSLVQDAVLTPLNLTHTFVSVPRDELGVIPGNRYKTSWAFEMGEESATGNMWTSVGDLSALGRGIMRSTLLKPAMTRRWLKPIAFTSDPKSMVGMPWGVRQINISQDSPYQFVHTFNKIGSLGSYTSMLAIIPELDIGFSILAAGDPPPGLAMDIADTLTKTYIPTLMYVARYQANLTYSGEYRYVSPNTTTTSGTNSTTAAPFQNSTSTSTATGAPFPTSSSGTSSNSSSTRNPYPPGATVSLRISTDPSLPGLGVQNWTANGVDMGLIAVAIGSNISESYIEKVRPSVRLYPTTFEEKTTGGGKKIAFKAVFEDVGLEANTNGSMSTDCASWVGVTSVVYGSRPLDMFVFEVDEEEGVVRAVENAALRVRMEKVS